MKTVNLVLFDGAVKILQLQDDNGTPLMSVGVMAPGTYDFGVAEHDEMVTVTHGQMTINAQTWAEGSGRVVKIKRGDQVQVSTANYAAWKTCFNGFDGW